MRLSALRVPCAILVMASVPCQVRDSFASHPIAYLSSLHVRDPRSTACQGCQGCQVAKRVKDVQSGYWRPGRMTIAG